MILRLLPILTLLAMFGPVAAGLWGAVLPAFGHLPAAGLTGPSLAPFRALAAWPGLPAAIRLSLSTGVLATFFSLAITMLIVAGWSGTRPFAWLQRVLAPILSVPHAAAAFGIAFLIAPSGWVFRLVATAAEIERPPDILILNDPWGFAMVAGLVAKEVPFLLLMTLAALAQAQSASSLRLAESLGYGRVTGWLKGVFPRVYAQIRLPVYVVLAYSMSVVDVALILGPTTPAPLSAQIVDWMGDPDLARRTLAAAGALLQLALVLAALIAWRTVERLVARLGRSWAEGGRRGGIDPILRVAALALGALVAAAVVAGLLILALWSVAGLWRFPSLLPDTLTGRSWVRHAPGLTEAAGETALISVTATGVALALVIGCLQSEHQRGRALSPAGLWLIYFPLLVPQIAFLPGLQTLLLQAGANTGLAPVIAAHLVFVLPYVFLSLGDPWRAWDARYATAAAALGAGSWRILFSVRLPMLLRPLLTAAAIGIAVSVGLYLPTLLVGGGRVSTLTTEAVALSTGGDRRAIGVFALSQTAAALLPFAFAIAVPALIYRDRRGLHG